VNPELETDDFQRGGSECINILWQFHYTILPNSIAVMAAGQTVLYSQHTRSPLGPDG
jgi:hypothetical protein